MAEQGSDSAKTEAFVVELVRQLSGQSTRLARQAGALAQSRDACWRDRACGSRGGRRVAPLRRQDRPAIRPRAGRRPTRSDVSIFWMEGVRQ